MVLPETFSPKSVDYRGIDEWYRLNEETRKVTSALYEESQSNRYRSQEVRNRAYRTSEWHARETVSALSDRAEDISRWLASLTNARQRVEEQFEKVKEAKKQVDNALLEKEPHLFTALGCLEIRDQRRDADLVRDQVHLQLLEERRVLGESKRQLILKGQELWDARFQLNNCLRTLQHQEKSKQLALESDRAQAKLTKDSKDVSFKPTAMDTPKNIVSERFWTEKLVAELKEVTETVETCAETVQSAETTVRRLQLEVNTELEKTRAFMKKRLAETEAERDHLEHQKNKLEEEIPRLYREILETETCLKETNWPLKLAQTRLENRKWVPNGEITHDFPRIVLHSEVEATRRTLSELDAQVRKSKKNLIFLQDQLYTVTKALELKEATIKLENLSFKSHLNPTVPEFRYTSLLEAKESDERIRNPAASDILEEFHQNLTIKDDKLYSTFDN